MYVFALWVCDDVDLVDFFTHSSMYNNRFALLLAVRGLMKTIVTYDTASILRAKDLEMIDSSKPVNSFEFVLESNEFCATLIEANHWLRVIQQLVKFKSHVNVLTVHRSDVETPMLALTRFRDGIHPHLEDIIIKAIDLLGKNGALIIPSLMLAHNSGLSNRGSLRSNEKIKSLFDKQQRIMNNIKCLDYNTAGKLNKYKNNLWLVVSDRRNIIGVYFTGYNLCGFFLQLIIQTSKTC